MRFFLYIFNLFLRIFHFSICFAISIYSGLYKLELNITQINYWNTIPSFLRSMLIESNLGQDIFLFFCFSMWRPVISISLKNYIITVFELFPNVKHAGTDYFPLPLNMPGIFLHPPIIFQGNPCVATQIPVVSRSYKFVFVLQGPECHGSWRGQQAALPSLGQWPR